MQTLRELGIFVGIPENSDESPSSQPIGLRLIGKLLGLAPDAPAGVGASMQAMLGLVKTLPPISLDAQLVNPDGGEQPYLPTIRIAPSAGLIISTRLHFFRNGMESSPSENSGAAGTDIAPNDLDPGAWTITVRRAGISDKGYVRLEHSLNAIVRQSPDDIHLEAWFVGSNMFIKGTGFAHNASVKVQYTFWNAPLGNIQGGEPDDVPTNDSGAFDAPPKNMTFTPTRFSITVVDSETKAHKTEDQIV